MIKKISCLLLCLSSLMMQAQTAVYRNKNATVDSRVEDLLARMSLREKFMQLYMIPDDLSGSDERFKDGIYGLQVSNASPEKLNRFQKYLVEQTRLGIPAIFFDEGLHGLVQKDATIFPQSIGLAASWDTASMHRVASCIAQECRCTGVRHILSPVLNIARDVRWGRTEETYGEDPYLVSLMAYTYIRELEQAGIIATPKHFAVNSGDGGRDSYPVDMDDRQLREIYFPAFKMAIQQGKARCVMAAYNSLNGSPCSANDYLLNQTLRKDWGFGGIVISDACATGGANMLHHTALNYADATENALNNGLDVIFQTSMDHYMLFYEAFEKGMIPQEVIDNAVRRVLRLKFSMGLFETPYAEVDPKGSCYDINAHRSTALKAAEESIVLLKNSGSVLPLKGGQKTIAVFGLNAATVNPGGYSAPPDHCISILEGMKKVANNNTSILYAPGVPKNSDDLILIDSAYMSTSIDGKTVHGLKAEYFDNPALRGLPQLSRPEKQLSGQWTLMSPDPKLSADWYSARWTTTLNVPKDGPFTIGLEGDDGYRLYLNDTLVIDQWAKVSYSRRTVQKVFRKGQPCRLRAEFFESSGNGRLKLLWNYGVHDSSSLLLNEAAALAAKADALVVVASIQEGEFRDRATLDLPASQEALIHRLAQNGKPLIVLLNAGSAVDISDWEEEADAILDVWYPGDEGGVAVANILYGIVNPAGRLPFSWPASEGQLPLVYNHKPTGRGDDYVDMSGMPRFPFGYGLSYSSFEYSALELPSMVATGDSVKVSCTIKNTGPYDGDEVVQLYIHDELASLVRPVKELKGFQRIFLKAGESRSISFVLPPSAFSFPGNHSEILTEKGDFRIMIGASSTDIRLRRMLSLH
jgi:beta-glucosidase